MDRINLAADMRRRARLDDPADGDQQPADGTFTEDDLELARAIDAERQRAIAIIKACELAGRQDLASDLVGGSGTVGDAIRTLQRAQSTARGPDRA